MSASQTSDVPTLLVKIFGKDRPGITAGLFDTLAAYAVDVVDPTGKQVQMQTLPNKDNSSLFDLAFVVSVPALGFSSYTITRSRSSSDLHFRSAEKHYATVLILIMNRAF